MFVPHLCHTIITLTEADDVLKEEIVDNELLYNMLLLTEVSNILAAVILSISHLIVVTGILAGRFVFDNFCILP